MIPASPTPRIDGSQVTFDYFGTPADGAPLLVGDFNNWARDWPPIPMSPIEAGYWTHTRTLPIDSYTEYAFVVDGVQIPDPRNPLSFDNNMGGVISGLWMPQAAETDLIVPIVGQPQGTISTHRIADKRLMVGGSREVILYQPPVDRPVPLVIVFDGEGYTAQAHLPTIVDNLIGQGRVQPIALAMIVAGGQGRTVEYACSDATVALIRYVVLPLAEQHLRLIDHRTQPGVHGLLGASMGGLTACYAALRAPEVFGRVLCQSGAFGGDQPEYRLYHRSVLDDLIRWMPRPPLRLWLDCGQQEWFLAPNRRMQALLTEHGYDFHYREHSSGHNYTAWRNSVWRGLEWLFA